MQLRQSQRMQARIKMALQGSSGSGKTYSSILLAKGLTNNNLKKVAIIDTENGSADLYAHLGNYNVVTVKPPFTPEKYIEAIEICEQAEMEVVIIDSISHCWDELLDYHSKLAGNSFTNWGKVTPRLNSLINKILQCNSHVIATMRTKQDYVLNQKDGKFIPEKVGLKSVMRDGLDYEFTLVFDVDIKHFATSSKDRTGLFMGKPEFTINENTGKTILNWCKAGTEDLSEVILRKLEQQENDDEKYITTPLPPSFKSKTPKVDPKDAFECPQDFNENKPTVSEEQVYNMINSCSTIQELYNLYKSYPQFQDSLKIDFEAKKSILLNSNTNFNSYKNGNPIQ